MNRREFLVAAAGAPFALHDLAGAVPQAIALVTADLESQIVAVRLSSGAVAATIATLSYPRSIETVGKRAVIGHSEIGAVSIVGGESLEVEHVLPDFGEPRYTAAHPDGRHAYVTDARRGELVALDVARGRVLGRTAVGALARHVSIDPAGRVVWVALGSKAEEVAVVDLSDRRVPTLTHRFRPPFLAHDVGFAPDGRRVWVSSGSRFELAVYDARSGRLLARPSGDRPPQHVTFAGDVAYVTSGRSGSLRLHRVDGRPIRMTPVPVGSYNVQHGAGRVVTPGLGTGKLCFLDEAGRLLRLERVARSSHDACIVFSAASRGAPGTRRRRTAA